MDRLQTGLNEQRRCTLVSAPAGYGKTTLITGWLHSLPESTRTIWLSLEKNDNEPVRFLSYWATAWSRISELSLENIRVLLDSPQLPPFQSILDEVINALLKRDEPAVFVLDDYHVITNPLIHEVLEYFLDHQPHQVHLVIITRSDPPLPLPRLRTRSQMMEIRAEDLRFTEEEASHFFQQSMQLELEESYIRSLELRTEGWAAGLQLAALAIKNRTDPERFVKSFSGSHRYVLDYLAEEVVHQQSKEVQRYLIQTAILERFNAESCEALTGNPHSRELLTELERANLFLIPLDDERVWYRYHHLFADFLRTELSQTEAERLYKKAATWHEQSGLLSEAVQYAIACGDSEFLADLIERGLSDPAIWSSGNLTLYATWLELLPPEAYHHRPALSLNASRISYLTGRFDLAEKQLDQAENALKTWPDAPETDQMLALASLYRGSIASVRGDTGLAIEKIRFAQERIPETHHLLHARGFFSLGLAYEISGQTELAVQNYLRSSEAAQTAGVHFLTIHAIGAAAQVLIAQGLLQQAEKSCRRAIEIAGGKPIPRLGLAESILGWIALERNDLAAAEEHLNNGISLSRRGGLVDDVILGLSHLSRLCAYQGKMNEAFEVAQDASEIIQGLGVARMSVLADAYIADLQLFAGREAAAAQWAADYQAARAKMSHAFMDLTLVRVLLKTGARESVPSILNALLEQSQSQRHMRTSIEVMILMALFHQAESDIPSAVEWLSRAVEMAAPEGFIRVFLNDGAALLGLLPKVRQDAPEFVDMVLDHLQPGSEKSPFDHLPEPLSEQELRVLGLIAAGKTNREIAKDLVISVGTAKWHVHNILQKLGVSNRAQAGARARELGF